MNNELIKNKLEAYLDIITYKQGKKYICPLCGSGTGKNKTPAGSVTDDKKYYHCFSCGFHGDIFTLIGAMENITEHSERFRRICQIFNFPYLQAKKDKKYNANQNSKIEKDFDYTEYFKKCHDRANDTDYFTFRGLSRAVIDKFDLGFDPEWQSPKALREGRTPPKSSRIIIPTSNHSYLARATDKTVNKYKAIKEGSLELFNTEVLYKYQVVFVVEGEIDALSVTEAGGQAVALGSIANKGKFINLCEKNPPSALIVLSLDNDEAGQETQQEIAHTLKRFKIAFLEANISGRYKDPNEHLISDFKAFYAIINNGYQYWKENLSDKAETEKKNSEDKYKKSAAAYLIKDLFEEIKMSNIRAIPTGFKEFDKILDGGLYEGLYIIGAVSSLGKTTFILQVGDQIAEQGYDVIIFSLEMGKYELISKSISRLTYQNCEGKIRNAKTTRGIIIGSNYANYSKEEKDLINMSSEKYKNYGEKIYIHEGVGDIGANEIRETLKNHIIFTGKKPVIIIDYLQILAPYDMKATDKQNTDKAVLELKRLSRDYKVPIITISSFNRENYRTEVSMQAFKESGAIEYSSDVLLGLQFKGIGENINEVELRKKNPRDIQLKILKNRNGQVGNLIDFEYYPLFNFFKEIGSNVDENLGYWNKKKI